MFIVMEQDACGPKFGTPDLLNEFKTRQIKINLKIQKFKTQLPLWSCSLSWNRMLVAQSLVPQIYWMNLKLDKLKIWKYKNFKLDYFRKTGHPDWLWIQLNMLYKNWKHRRCWDCTSHSWCHKLQKNHISEIKNSTVERKNSNFILDFISRWDAAFSELFCIH